MENELPQRRSDLQFSLGQLFFFVLAFSLLAACYCWIPRATFPHVLAVLAILYGAKFYIRIHQLPASSAWLRYLVALLIAVTYCYARFATWNYRLSSNNCDLYLLPITFCAIPTYTFCRDMRAGERAQPRPLFCLVLRSLLEIVLLPVWYFFCGFVALYLGWIYP